MKVSFTNRVAIVTSAASGTGRACVQRYAREGATVLVSDVDEAGRQGNGATG